MKYTIPCLFGLEALVADELRRLDLKNVRAENGRVHCDGGPADIPRLNINLRCGARVLVELASFPAPDFEALFQGVAAIPWEDCIPRDGEFPVKGYSISSHMKILEPQRFILILKLQICAELSWNMLLS
uniref:hypothetical protein n=1 Tax=Dysosmobacter welbionis TaxID=2093857 RepID=UPI003FEDDDC6